MTDDTRLHFRSVTFKALEPGPRLIVLGAVHGNETCGARAITRVLGDLEAGRLSLRAGTATFVPVTNPLAYAKGTRSGDRNLNRRLRPTDDVREFEDHVANWLCPLLAQHDVLLDLHSMRAGADPFALVGPRNNAGPIEPFAHEERERALVRRLGVKRFVEGWLSTYARGVERRGNGDFHYGVGTTEYMRSVGGYAITLECGQHESKAAPEVAYRAIRNTLAYLGLSEDPLVPAVENFEMLKIVDVIDRDHERDQFCREWSSFDAVASGQLIATRADGTAVTAPFDGMILFPDAGAEPGHEWFYLAQPGTL